MNYRTLLVVLIAVLSLALTIEAIRNSRPVYSNWITELITNASALIVPQVMTVSYFWPQLLLWYVMMASSFFVVGTTISFMRVDPQIKWRYSMRLIMILVLYVICLYLFQVDKRPLVQLLVPFLMAQYLADQPVGLYMSGWYLRGHWKAIKGAYLAVGAKVVQASPDRNVQIRSLAVAVISFVIVFFRHVILFW